MSNSPTISKYKNDLGDCFIFAAIYYYESLDTYKLCWMYDNNLINAGFWLDTEVELALIKSIIDERKAA